MAQSHLDSISLSSVFPWQVWSERPVPSLYTSRSWASPRKYKSVLRFKAFKRAHSFCPVVHLLNLVKGFNYFYLIIFFYIYLFPPHSILIQQEREEILTQQEWPLSVFPPFPSDFHPYLSAKPSHLNPITLLWRGHLLHHSHFFEFLFLPLWTDSDDHPGHFMRGENETTCKWGNNWVTQ